MSNFWQVYNDTAIGVGFGTAGLGGNTYSVAQLALENGFRKFDTAEADWWYNQAEVGRSLQDFYTKTGLEDCIDLQISTKIPPWSLTSVSDIRRHASTSRNELVGFCKDRQGNKNEEIEHFSPIPLDVYYIHAPRCWSGWHPKCDDPPSTLELKDAWKAMEAVAGIDHTAKRIGLSNVHPTELLDIIHWVQHRIEAGETYPPPRIPDVLQAYADPIHTAAELRQICEDHGIEFVSYSTLGTQHRNTDENPVLTSLVVQHLAEKHQRSVAEVVLSWALQNNMSVIPRSSKKQHIEELARLLSSPTFLEEEDLLAMDTLSNDYVGEL
ncbi:2,5-didehydrogluconate reductase [Nitzschia inconspicua]|uniref:2,5-didehydrogluconate reductase n=1 Tax=Nitzschia inconspicua TaxID=303405 RepID=A0A9K3KSS3_9STRA|nr:2,5-didehydrogluconate reductase [Nitzschia inconspicua]